MRWILCAALFFNFIPSLTTNAAVVELADNGKSKHSVVVSDNASPRVREAARELADYLGRISGATFEVGSGNGDKGIAVGVIDDFPALKLKEDLAETGIAAAERYLLRSHTRGLHVIGRSDFAVEHAVWDLLHSLGHRQFFPGEHWEVVPREPNLRIEVDRVEAPDYALRQIWPGYGTWPENTVELKAWDRRNRANAAFELNTGHVYETIVAHNRDVFTAHPEYFALVDGKRTSDKLCTSNPGLQALAIEHSLRFLQNHPEANSVSIEPSDGYGWCECEPCAQIGTPSDRALLLANRVAEAIAARFPDKYAAMYAYAGHSAPPTKVKAHPNVIISVATAFMPQGTPASIVEGWKNAGTKQFGIREYYSVIAWDHDWPGTANGSNTAYLTRTIPEFHTLGARFITAEASDNWGPNGLGYYLASRMLWDTDQAEQVEALKQDFYEKAFGPASAPMKAFYESIDGASKPLLSADLVGRMYRKLDEARSLAAGVDQAILDRIDALVLYTRYVELYRAYEQAAGDARQTAFATLIGHAYRMRRTHMVHSVGLYRDLYTRDKTVAIPENAGWDVPEGTNPWKSSEQWTAAELQGFLQQGIAANPLLDFQPVAFSEKLVPAAKRMKLGLAPARMPPVRQDRGTVRYYIWVERAPATIDLEVTGGLIYGTLGDITVRLFPVAELMGRSVAEQTLPPDKQPHKVTLQTKERGLHYIEIFDNHDGTRVKWEPGIPWTVPLTFGPRYDAEDQAMYFYVPRGTKVLGGYAGVNRGKILDPDGNVALELDPEPDFFSIPVSEGKDGKLWSLTGQTYSGRFMLMTVPPYMARSADELLLPEEVVEADR